MIEQLEKQVSTLEIYLKMKVEQKDWHGVSDAANDLREANARIDVLAEQSREEDTFSLQKIEMPPAKIKYAEPDPTLAPPNFNKVPPGDVYGPSQEWVERQKGFNKINEQMLKEDAALKAETIRNDEAFQLGKQYPWYIFGSGINRIQLQAQSIPQGNQVECLHKKYHLSEDPKTQTTFAECLNCKLLFGGVPGLRSGRNA